MLIDCVYRKSKWLLPILICSGNLDRARAGTARIAEKKQFHFSHKIDEFYRCLGHKKYATGSLNGSVLSYFEF